MKKKIIVFISYRIISLNIQNTCILKTYIHLYNWCRFYDSHICLSYILVSNLCARVCVSLFSFFKICACHCFYLHAFYVWTERTRRGGRGSNNPISDIVSTLPVCVHAGACGLQMSLISADSSWEFLMLGSHAFSSGLSQAAAGSICDSCSNLRCHIEKPNWTRAYIGAAFPRWELYLSCSPGFITEIKKMKVKASKCNDPSWVQIVLQWLNNWFNCPCWCSCEILLNVPLSLHPVLKSKYFLLIFHVP